MKVQARYRDKAEASVSLASAIADGAKIGGIFEVEAWKPDGTLAWREKCHNVVTNEGLNHILNVVLNAATPITTWYCSLVESNTTPIATLTYAVPTYDEIGSGDVKAPTTTRQEYIEATSTSQSITNSANKASFTMNASITLFGACVVGGGSAATTLDDTAGGGTLLCYAKFGASQVVQADYVVNLTYTIGAADDGV